jgi:multicomponent Na+:H+ antiporter subunit E
MPGTVGVDMNDAGVLLHVLDERLPIVAETRALEAVIARLFGILP